MKIVDASWRIDDIPEGEAALAKLERLGRIAYKSEDKIDDGGLCQMCLGSRHELDTNDPCFYCHASGKDHEPSSHKFVRMILQAERKAKMILLSTNQLHDWVMNNDDPTMEDTEATASQLVQNIVDYMRQNPAHESVIEHCSATVVFTSNRGFTHEIVRHRLASFTQESTRYCDYDKGKFGSEISVIERTFWGKNKDGEELRDTMERLQEAAAVWRDAMRESEIAYYKLRKLDIPPEIARDVLPNALKADIGITANFREWRHIFSLRDSPRAHPDMRQLMGPLHEEFRKHIPIVFD